MSLYALALALAACNPSGPGFGGGGDPLEPDSGWWRGSTDTAAPPLDDDDLLDCVRRGDVEVVGGRAPPDIQGYFSVAGELTASDTDYPDGSATSGQLCISDQGEDLSIAVREAAAMASSESTWAVVYGYDEHFTVWMELEGDDPHDGDCAVTSLAVMAGEVDGDDLVVRTATVVVELTDCEAMDPDMLGGCWATEARATRTGDCSG